MKLPIVNVITAHQRFFYNEMRCINLRFTYLLTYLLLCTVTLWRYTILRVFLSCRKVRRYRYRYTATCSTIYVHRQLMIFPSVTCLASYMCILFASHTTAYSQLTCSASASEATALWRSTNVLLLLLLLPVSVARVCTGYLLVTSRIMGSSARLVHASISR